MGVSRLVVPHHWTFFGIGEIVWLDAVVIGMALAEWGRMEAIG
jgi:hypothetical protein